MCIDENAAQAAEITGLKQLIGDLQLRNQATLADNAALRDALVRWIVADGSPVFSEEDEALAELALRLKDDPVDHPCAALLAELGAARAVVESCEIFASFVEDYTLDSPLAGRFPGFYADLRRHGKNARAAVEQARKARSE